MIIPFILLLIGAYLLGSVPAAQIMARWVKGIDLKQFGSGNVGASNLIQATSKLTSAPVFIFDFAKGFMLVLAAKWLGLDAYAQVAVGIAAIIGHNWPVFLRFSGGRGALTALALVVALAPWLTLLVLVLLLIFVFFRQLALGVLLAVLGLPLAAWFIVPPIGDANPVAYTAGFAAILVIIVVRRLTAPVPAIAAGVPRTERLVNRFLFDRDIRDRQTWITGMTAPREPQEPERETNHK